MSLDAEMSDSESNSSIHIDKLDNGVGADYGKLAGALDTSGIKAAIDASGLADSIASKGLKATIDSGALEKVANISGIAKSIDTGALKAASEALGGAHSDIGKRFSSVVDDAAFKGIDAGSLTSRLSAMDYSIPDLSYAVSGGVADWHQLIVIGNGFDLQCGLRSKFGDFFQPRFEKIKGISDYKRETWKQVIMESGLTVWDFILEANLDSLWCDIEAVIERWVLSASFEDRTPSPFRKAVEHIKLNPFTDGVFVLVNGRRKSEQDDESFMLGNIARYAWTLRPEIVTEGYNRDDFMRLLKHDLYRLERAFGEYLSSEVADNEGYAEKCSCLYGLIERDGKKSGEGYLSSTSVLSFNYTEQISKCFDGGEEGACVNIHGKLGGQIIFGIDGKDCMDNPDAVAFTKTFRLMQIGGSRTDKLISTANSANLRDATDVIKFYGHSLGKADYSYFQSIFDGVDLYESKTVLVFYYPYSRADGAETQNERWRTCLANSINNLLVDYGATMDNQDHGKNLLHKLLLEGRLIIRGVETA